MAVTHLNPNFVGQVGEVLAVDFELPTYVGQSDDPITHWVTIPSMPPGLDWDGSEIAGTPLVAGTYLLTYVFLATVERKDDVDGSTTIYSTEEFEWTVTAYILGADDTLPTEEETPTSPEVTLLSMETDVREYSFGAGITGATLAELADSVNAFFSIGGFDARAYTVGNQFLVSFENGETLSTVTISTGTVDFTEVIAPASEEFQNSKFFGKDDPDDEEYSYYTLINTNVC